MLACGIGNDFVDRLQWVLYGGETAVANAEVRIDDCDPDRAAGKLISYPAVVTLSNIVRCADGRRYYSTLGMTFTQTVPLSTPFVIEPDERCSPA